MAKTIDKNKNKRAPRSRRGQTPTPWAVFPSAIGDRAYIGRSFSPDVTHGVFVRSADAKRAVLCVNSCDGLTNDQLASMPGTILELLQTLRSKLQ